MITMSVIKVIGMLGAGGLGLYGLYKDIKYSGWLIFIAVILGLNI